MFSHMYLNVLFCKQLELFSEGYEIRYYTLKCYDTEYLSNEKLLFIFVMIEDFLVYPK